MIDAVVAKIYEYQMNTQKQSDYSAFIRDASKKDKERLLKKAAKIAKHEQLKVLKDAQLKTS